MKKVIFALSLLIAMAFSACEEENETVISTFDSSESHNIGRDCIECHKSGGEGEGWFTVAGSVYDVSLANLYAGATVKLSTEPLNGGTIVKTIEVDKKGNFYTTENVSFTDGLYVSVTGKTGIVKYMTQKISSGHCNNCHGTNKIGVE